VALCPGGEIVAKTFPFPIIPKADYPAFRAAVGPELADTYEEWLKRHANQIDEARRRGENIAEIEVNFDEFTRFCSSTRTTPNLKTLLDFTIEKSAGQRY
jgi:hypothetical protein